ncbi:hypothetical protein BJY21_001601 [Kineosphaera limosa]|nr:hypothetical protein [Kineosphaera limosa]
MRALASLPTRAQLAATAQHIASAQAATGAIAWDTVGDTAGKVDAWDHVECAMALLAAGRDEQALRAYDWLLAQQRPDGTWPREWHVRPDGQVRVVDPAAETNMCAYLAVGAWHHWCARGDAAVAARLWPGVEAALDAVVAASLPSGAIAWAIDPAGPCGQALLAGSASIHHALRCGARLAEALGLTRPDWELAADTLAQAIGLHCAADDASERFLDKARYSMDWYYPVLGGALTAAAGRARLARRWDDFVVPGLGIRCVDDHPWVTGAETCELALALLRLGDRRRAIQLIADMQHLRDATGAYHSGYVYPDDEFWPIERSSWTSAAVILAVDALDPTSASAAVFAALG